MGNHQTTARLLLAIALAGVLAVAATVSSAQQVDRVTGLVKEAGWQMVQANCTACHSAQLIAQNSGSRAVWKSRIVWMQETQGLEQLGNEVETTILDYLADNYGQKAAGRRAGLAAQLLPANPFDG